MPEPVLALQGLRKAFGGLLVIAGVDLELHEGELLGLIGPNGAGKTTLVNLVAGNVVPDGGQVLLQEKRIDTLPPPVRAREGLGRTHQTPKPFGSLTVWENVWLAAHFGAGLKGRAAEELTAEALERVGMLSVKDMRSERLKLAQLKRLEIARALALRPKVLLLDEIAGGLGEQEVQDILQLILRMKSEGLAILWIEHIVHALAQAADRLAVLHFGSLLRQGLPAEVLKDPVVQEIYLGQEVEGA